MIVALATNNNSEKVEYIILGRCAIPDNWNRPYYRMAIRPPMPTAADVSCDVPLRAPNIQIKEFRLVCHYGVGLLLVDRINDVVYLPDFDDRTDRQIIFDRLTERFKEMANDTQPGLG
ncbi:MAG TPA: hypothetical protein DCS07_10570 [Bdellovibrionales bacterium]|nr:hypothetical protein [Bdellovibrionales bacterium]